MADIQVLYEDATFLVCRKPPGVAVQTRRIGQPDMESLLKNYRADKGEPAEIFTVHRLDQPVIGVMVFAKTPKAASALGRQMAGGAMDKWYYALVDGVPSPPKGTLTDYLLRDGQANTSSVVDKGTEGAKRAELSYEVVERLGGQALLRIRLLTGRHHQIRVQLAHAGWPIVGDAKYNFKENIAPSGRGLALCAYMISFRHPVTLKKVAFEYGIDPHDIFGINV